MEASSSAASDVDDTRIVTPAPSSAGADVEPQAGTSLGRYLVIEAVGRGGMGLVLRAYDPKLQREVALKCLRPEQLLDELKVRMIAEAQAMARINHRNVVSIYDVEQLDEQVVLAMEFVRGPTLRRWLEQSVRPWRDIVGLFIGAGRGLQAAHDADLLHRDFKPDNVLVGEDGEPKVGDFGIARLGTVTRRPSTGEPSPDPEDDIPLVGTALTQAGTVMGTVAFMAPEQRAGGTLTPATDQYAYCVSLWLALTGAHPFRNLATGTVDRRWPPKWPSGAPPVPRRIVDAIVRGLSPDASARWPGMAALLAALSFDPTKQRRRRLAVAGLLGIASASGMWFGIDRALVTRACETEGRAIEATWNAVAADEIATAFAATGIAYAPDTWSRAHERVEAFAEQWRRERTSACLRGQRDDVWDGDTMVRSRACFDELRVRLETLVAQWRMPNATTVNKTGPAAWQLPAPNTCADQAELAHRLMNEDPALLDVEQSLRNRLAEAAALQATSNYEEAKTIAQEVVDEAERLDLPLVLTEARQTRGDVREALGEYALAIADFEEAFAGAERNGDDRLAFRAAMAFVAVADHTAEYDKGLWWAWLAEQKQRRLQLGAEHPDVAALLNRLGNLYESQGRLDEAASSHQRSLAILEKVLGPDHPSVGRSFNNAGNVSLGRGRLDEAASFYRRALAIWEQALGPDHPDVAKSLNNLGIVAESQGRHDEAASFHRRALAIWEQALGPDHPDVARSLHNAGVVAASQGRLAEAASFYRRALTIREQALGSGHPDVAQSLDNLGIVLLSQGRLEESEVFHRRALAIREQALGPDHPDVGASLCNLGLVASSQGRLDEAVAFHERGLAIREQALGPDHADVAMSLTNLAFIAYQQRRFTEAAAFNERSLAIREQAFGPTHPDVAVSLNNLALVHEAQGRIDRAAPIHARALAIREEVFGPDHSEVATSLNNLGLLYASQGRFDEAWPLLRRALSIWEHALGPDHYDVTYPLVGLGRMHIARGEYAVAEPLLERALAIRTKHQSPALERAEVRFGLARALAGDRAPSGRALDLARAASDELPPGSQERAEVDAWLDR